MNARALIPLIAGLGIGGLALKLGLDFVQRARGAQSADTQVLVAQQDIPRWVTIDDNMLNEVVFPAKAVPPGAFVDREELVGRVLRMATPGGVPILESMLLPPGAKPGLVVPKGFRAVAVKIDEGSGVDYHLEPGCRVDVIGYFSVRKGGETQMVAQTILKDIEVGAVGPQLSSAGNSEKDESAKVDSRRQQKVRAVTLFVKPGKVPTLHMAEQRGKIKLAMRGSDEDTPSEGTYSVSWDELLGGKQQPQRPASAESGGLLGGLMSMISKSQPQPAPLLEPPLPEPGAPARPTLAWVMRVWNGDEMRRLGWHGLDSFEAIDLTQAVQLKAESKAPSSSGASAGRADGSTGADRSPLPVQPADGAEDHVDPEPEELDE
jgi:pilus assembly protein CpaB